MKCPMCRPLRLRKILSITCLIFGPKYLIFREICQLQQKFEKTWSDKLRKLCLWKIKLFRDRTFFEILIFFEGLDLQKKREKHSHLIGHTLIDFWVRYSRIYTRKSRTKLSFDLKWKKKFWSKHTGELDNV